MTMNSVRLTQILAQTTAIAALFALGGCMSSPTYGTGVTANEQLLQDVSSSFSLKPKQGPKIAYQPRPELLKDASAKGLPAPQENVTQTAGVWPESPEQKRARLRQEATDNQGDPLYVPKIENDISGGNTETLTGSALADKIARQNSGQASEDFKRRKAQNAAGSPTTRKLLSEPPLDYRQPAATAAYGDVGEDESKKERRLRAEAKKKKGGGGLKSLIPWL
jgi:hypothetical protein